MHTYNNYANKEGLHGKNKCMKKAIGLQLLFYKNNSVRAHTDCRFNLSLPVFEFVIHLIVFHQWPMGHLSLHLCRYCF